jgi:glucose/arabinose dehydrogenase
MWARLRSLSLCLAVLLPACAGDERTTRDAQPTTRPTPTGTADTTTDGRPPGARPLRLVVVVAGLEAPTHLTSTPSEPRRLYVTEQAGRIRVIENGKLSRRPFLDIRDQVASGGERGLLSLAFHPDYERNRLFYVDYTDVAGDTRVVEYRNRETAAPLRQRELLFVDQPYANHNGGQLAFGPDGRLYAGLGDGGSGGDPENRAQDLSSLLGKLLSTDVDDGGARWRIEGYGLRNPWRFSFDRETGDLWIADVGQSEWEEIDYTPHGSAGVENYGWDAFEGRHPFEDKEPNPRGGLVGPIAEYGHDLGCSVTGGFVYHGEAVPSAQGRYFYGDYCSGTVWSVVERVGTAAHRRRHTFRVETLTSFGEDAAGELYLVAQAGNVFRLAGG